MRAWESSWVPRMRACVEPVTRSSISRVSRPLPRIASVCHAPRIDATTPPAPVHTPNHSHQVIDLSCCVGAPLYPQMCCNCLARTSADPPRVSWRVTRESRNSVPEKEKAGTASSKKRWSGNAVRLRRERAIPGSISTSGWTTGLELAFKSCRKILSQGGSGDACPIRRRAGMDGLPNRRQTAQVFSTPLHRG